MTFAEFRTKSDISQGGIYYTGRGAWDDGGPVSIGWRAATEQARGEIERLKDLLITQRHEDEVAFKAQLAAKDAEIERLKTERTLSNICETTIGKTALLAIDETIALRSRLDRAEGLLQSWSVMTSAEWFDATRAFLAECAPPTASPTIEQLNRMKPPGGEQ